MSGGAEITPFPGASATPVANPATEGVLTENVTYFARALRQAGMKLGPRDVVDAVEALASGGLGEREDVYWTLHALFVKRRQDSGLYDQAFELFFRKRGHLERIMQLLLPPASRDANRPKKPQANRRIADALFGNTPPPTDLPPRPQIDIDAKFSVSEREILRAKDFEQMTAEEVSRARRIIGQLDLPFDDLKTHRMVADPRGAVIDMRRTMRRALRSGGEVMALERKGPMMRKPPIVAICDISGSMSDYSRMFLHFLHALTEKRRHVHSFVFATRLTNITRQLQYRDPDAALENCARGVEDWAGGTRLGECLESFNRQWSRRVLGQGATVLLMTDGLERSPDQTGLERQIDRLHKSCRKLVWLNPLLRYDQFEAKASGIRTLLPHVDAFCPVHNLNAIEGLAQALKSDRFGYHEPKAWLRRTEISA